MCVMPAETCRKGHPLTEANTYRYTPPDGCERRYCRTCRRSKAAELRARQNEQEAAA